MKIFIKYRVKSVDRSKPKKVVVVCDTLEEAWKVYSEAKSLSGISYLTYTANRMVSGTYDVMTPDMFFKNPY